MFGSSVSSANYVPALFDLGQSNGDGNAQSERLANTLWNYKGISNNVWPTTRVAEAQYVTNPSGVDIFNNQHGSGFQDWFTPTGAWQPYVMGTNSRNRTFTGQDTYFGMSAIAAQYTQDVTAGNVAIIKPSFPGVGLLNTTSSIDPGPWLNICTTIATQAYIKPAAALYSAYRSGAILYPAAINWWQGEGDANAAVSTAAYKAGMLTMMNTVNFFINAYYPIRVQPIWNLVAIDVRTANGNLINTALSQLATDIPTVRYIDVHLGKSLWKNELTVAQASPLTKGINDVTPNAAGGLDDDHSNYIAQQLVGETIAKNVIAAGILI